MAVISGGNVIRNTTQTPGSKTRIYTHSGAPVAGTTLAGVITPGQFVEDSATGDLYEYTEPAAVPTFTRRDTV